MLGGRFSASTGPIGIDVGSRAIRLVQLREAGGPLQVTAAACVEIAPDGPVEPAGLTAALRDALRSGGFAGRRCVVGLPRADVRVQTVRVPAANDEQELHRIAVREAARRFGVEGDAMEVNVLRTGATFSADEGRDEILLVAASRDAVHAIVDPLVAAGLKPRAVETDFAALARACSARCRRDADRDRVRAVLDVGRTGSTVMILRGDEITCCRRLEIGGARFDEAVADHLRMDGRAVAELRRARHRHGGADESALDRATERSVSQAVRPLLGDLVKEVMLCLRYYGVTFRSQPPTHIVLTGGDAREPGLAHLLSESCKLPTVTEEEGVPLEAMHARIRATLGDRAGTDGTWMVAIGLALRGLPATGGADGSRPGRPSPAFGIGRNPIDLRPPRLRGRAAGAARGGARDGDPMRLPARLRAGWASVSAGRRGAGIAGAVLVLGMLLWARIIVISNVPKMAIADPEAPEQVESPKPTASPGDGPSDNRARPAEPAGAAGRGPRVIDSAPAPRPIIEGQLPSEAGKSDPQRVEDPEQTDTRLVARLRALVATIRLEAITRGKPVAVLNGATYRSGQVVPVEGEQEIRFTLVEVKARSVILEYRGHRFELEMRSPDFK